VRPIVLLTGAVVALVALLPSRAEASTVSVVGRELIFQAGPGEANVVEINQENQFLVGIRDLPTGGPAAGAGCFPANASGFVFCNGEDGFGVNSVKIVTGDLGDRIVPLGSFFGIFPRPFDVELGAGNDEATAPRGEGVAHTIRGGAGNDRLFGATGDDTLEGGEGPDSLFMSEGDDRLVGGTSFDEGGFPHSDVVLASFAQRDGATMVIGQGRSGVTSRSFGARMAPTGWSATATPTAWKGSAGTTSSRAAPGRTRSSAASATTR
jgi:Ca2+-binding RTX toxin-like protein